MMRIIIIIIVTHTVALAVQHIQVNMSHTAVIIVKRAVSIRVAIDA